MNVLAIFVCVWGPLLLVDVTTGSDASWDYKDNVLGPSRWPTVYPECGNTSQSPINIVTDTVKHDPDLADFDLSGYISLERAQLTLSNVGGHTVSVTFSASVPPEMVIQGGGLPEEYVMHQLHFHWGSDDNRGSEHTVDGEAYAMEMHIVHHRRSSNMPDSVDAPSGLAVLGFFFEVGSPNLALDDLLSSFEDVSEADEMTQLASTFHLADLLPFDRDPENEERLTTNGHYYYRYKGSLTTPPCYQSVIWTVFSDPINISKEQLAQFRLLMGVTEGEHMSDNFRPVQKLNYRQVTTNDPAEAPSVNPTDD